MEWSLAQMVISKQGRDNGAVYLVVKIEGRFCYVADGRKTTAEKPKKKNVKHLQATKSISVRLQEALHEGKQPTAAEIREFLNNQRSQNRVQEVPDVKTRCD